MFLFILENIGTSELLLIGLVALIFLGPRKMPEMARKIGKIMSEFRNTTSQFKETWEREINFEQEIKAFDVNTLDTEPVARVESITASPSTDAIEAPAIKQIDAATFDQAKNAEPAKSAETTTPDTNNDKQNWL